MRPAVMRHNGSILKALLVALGISSFTSLMAQNDTLRVTEGIVYEPIEEYPEFPGGETELNCFIERVVDKDLLSKLDTIGMAWAQFTIDTLGNVSGAVITKSLVEEVDQELLRIIGLMPQWKPGRLRGKLVATGYNLPLKVPYKNWCR